MRVAYYLTTPPPPEPALDAAFQEVENLRETFVGPLTWLYPSATYRPWIARRRLRATAVRAWLDLDRVVDLHHVVSDRPFGYGVLSRLRRPVVCRLLVPPADRPAVRRALASYRAIVVSSPAAAERLRTWGLPRVAAIPPGIELERFRALPPPPAEAPFTVLMASAPWTGRQFRSKGVDALLAAAAERPALRLVFLWRGVLAEAMERRIRRAGLADRVQLIARRIDPGEVLRHAHAAILVTSSPRVVKDYPHSLLEALAAGRPVVTSPQLAVADLVRETGCGVLASCRAESIGEAIDRLVDDYERHRTAAAALDLGTFAAERCVAAHGELFASLASC